MPPSLRVYFGAIPAGCVGIGQGVYDDAGYCGPRWLRPVVRLFAGRGVMFPERGAAVPFAITNMPQRDGSLRAERDFFFPGAQRRMVDAMSIGRSGEIIDRLGCRGGLEVRLRARAEASGMRLRSVGLALHLGRVRLPLPRVAGVEVTETAGRANGTSQHVDVRVRAWLLGELFRYEGTFAYRIQPLDGKPGRGVVPPA